MATYQRAASRVVALRPRHDLHLLRKGWHIATGSLGLFIYHVLEIEAFSMGIGLLIFALAGFTLEMLRLKIPALNQVALNAMGPFMRECERNKVSGLPFYALGVSLALLLFEERLAVLAICFLVFADPLASLAGILLGKDKILPNKSLQGAVAGFCICYLLTLVYGILHGANQFNLLLFAIAAGLIGMMSEIISAFGIDDNLSIPVISGFGLTLLNLILTVF